MKKIYYILIIIIVVFGSIGVFYLYFPFKFRSEPISLQSVYTISPPKIDGYFNSTEWTPAYNISFFLVSSRGESRPGELYILNNTTHLFLAFRILNEDYDGPPYPQGDADELRIWLDINNNEELDNYEDIKILETSNTPYNDAYHTSPPWIYICPDSNYGGTKDGYAFWNHTNPTGTGILTFETVFPFVSSDPHDLNVTRGTTLGIDFEYSSPTTSSFLFRSEWPGDNAKPNEWAKLVIA